jgi:hypothetical protein
MQGGPAYTTLALGVDASSDSDRGVADPAAVVGFAPLKVLLLPKFQEENSALETVGPGGAVGL